MEKTEQDILAFIEGLPDDRRDAIRALDAALTGVMGNASKTLYVGRFWGGSDQKIIGYGTQHSVRSDKKTVEWFVVGLALQKSYISVYVNVVEDGRYLAEVHGPDLGKVKIGKSSISFAKLEDIDLDKLKDLVSRARDLTATGT